MYNLCAPGIFCRVLTELVLIIVTLWYLALTTNQKVDQTYCVKNRSTVQTKDKQIRYAGNNP